MEKLPEPSTGRDIFRLSIKERLIFHSVIAFNKLTGRWNYPAIASGDLETMKKIDLIYWFYKAAAPHTRAVKNSGLEAFFENQKAFRYSTPVQFSAKDELTLSAVGDLMDHPYLANSSEDIYREVADTIFGADVSMGNLECVVYTDAKPFVFKLPESPPLVYTEKTFNVVKGFQNRKYTFLATANNHSLDCGEAGVDCTIRMLKNEDIAFHGMNETEKDAEIATVVNKKGFKLGLISHTFGLNAKKPPKEKPWIINRTHLLGKLHEVDFSRIERQIRYCHENKVDAVIAHLHWGMEHELYPRPEQIEIAHYLSEMGGRRHHWTSSSRDPTDRTLSDETRHKPSRTDLLLHRKPTDSIF